MSSEGKAPGEGGTPAYITRFDGVRVATTDYRPVWLDNLADDVTIEGSAMNGVVQGAEAVLVARNSAGQAQHIVANYRPRSTLLHLSRLIGEQLAGTAYGEHFATSAPE